MTHRDMDDIFYDCLNHLVSEEAQSTISESDWSYVDGYVRWFFRVSYPYMIQDAQGNPLRHAHHKILEDERARADYAIDVLPRCHRIMEIG